MSDQDAPQDSVQDMPLRYARKVLEANWDYLADVPLSQLAAVLQGQKGVKCPWCPADAGMEHAVHCIKFEPPLTMEELRFLRTQVLPKNLGGLTRE